MHFEKVSLSQYLKDFAGDSISSPSHTVMMSSLSDKVVTMSTFSTFQTDTLEKIHEDIKLPKRATMKSAGYDFYAPYDFTISAGETLKISTGIRIILDDDKFLMCAPRSGHGFKARIQLDNTIGIIDADYSDSSNEGHIILKLTNDSRTGKGISVKKGDGMVQAIILSYFTVDNDETTRKRDGGFGSTDIKEGVTV